jgi:transcriptional regulator with XRE-family HTH domain
MTLHVKPDKAGRTAKTPVAPRRKGRASGNGALRHLREKYGIDTGLLARLLDVDQGALAKWEAGGRMARDARARAEKLEALLHGLNRVMARDAIAPWLAHPNDACRSAGVQTPADLIAAGRYDKIEAMIYFFESGVPY